MVPVQNSFSPGAGTPPPELAGRGELLEEARVMIGRALNGRSTQGMLMTGLRGVCKTVILNELVLQLLERFDVDCQRRIDECAVEMQCESVACEKA